MTRMRWYRPVLIMTGWRNLMKVVNMRIKGKCPVGRLRSR
jgi:hypothetical protein